MGLKRNIRLLIILDRSLRIVEIRVQWEVMQSGGIGHIHSKKIRIR